MLSYFCPLFCKRVLIVNMRRSYILSWGVMSLLFIVLLGTLIKLYGEKEANLIETWKNNLEGNIDVYNRGMMNTGDSIKNILSLTLDRIIVLKDRRQYVFYFDSELEADRMSVSGMYDIRDTALWTLQGLDSLFRRQIDKEAVHYMLELQDSTGKVIDVVRRGFNKIPQEKEDFSMPLGLLEKHIIKARFGLPLGVFIYDEWPMVLFLVASAWMLGLIFYWQHDLVHKEKRIRQHEELNIQTVNHDMKSPVGIAGTYLALVEWEGISGLTLQQQKNFRVAQEAIGRLDILVKKMSAKLVNEKGLVLNYDVFELPVLVQEVMRSVEQEIPVRKKVRFSVLCRMRGDRTIRADRLQLGRALGNLLRNSVKYSGEEVDIVVGCIRKGARLLIFVRDDGYGIKKADQKHMFETGYRSPAVERRTEGTGLGLSFVKMVMSAHGGRIAYRTREGGGSRFVLIMKNKQR